MWRILFANFKDLVGTASATRALDSASPMADMTSSKRSGYKSRQTLSELSARFNNFAARVEQLALRKILKSTARLRPGKPCPPWFLRVENFLTSRLAPSSIPYASLMSYWGRRPRLSSRLVHRPVQNQFPYRSRPALDPLVSRPLDPVTPHRSRTDQPLSPRTRPEGAPV